MPISLLLIRPRQNSFAISSFPSFGTINLGEPRASMTLSNSRATHALDRDAPTTTLNMDQFKECSMKINKFNLLF